MEDFFIEPAQLLAILHRKRVRHLYHANTVATSLTFIRQGALLSRAYVENSGLSQTPQKSDEADKSVDVWDDVFLDGQDHHRAYQRPNKYGPVLFKIKLDILLSNAAIGLRVCKSNPWYWRDNDDSKHYYKDLSLFDSEYLNGKRLDSEMMFTIHNPNKSINLSTYLEGIIVDDPRIELPQKSGEPNFDIGTAVYNRIRAAMDENNLQNVPIDSRHAADNFRFCNCKRLYHFLYQSNREEFLKRFSHKLSKQEEIEN